MERFEKPVGVQILGPHAGERLNEWVAGSVLTPKSFSHRVHQGLELFSNLKGRACSLPADKGSQDGGGSD